MHVQFALDSLKIHISLIGSIMTKQTKHSLAYLRFLNLMEAIRGLPTHPTLDPVEERLLNLLAASWHAGKQVSVLEAMGMSKDMSATTAHRRLKTLRSKGMISLDNDKIDSRIKYVVPTPIATEYFSALGKCLDQASQQA